MKPCFFAREDGLIYCGVSIPVPSMGKVGRPTIRYSVLGVIYKQRMKEHFTFRFP